MKPAPIKKDRIILLASRDKGIVVHAENDFDQPLRARLHVFCRLGILYVEKNKQHNQLHFKLRKDTYLL